jgi:hypothetical protein
MPFHRRLPEGLSAIAGVLTFAWSTGVLLTLARGFLEPRNCWYSSRDGRGTDTARRPPHRARRRPIGIRMGRCR